MRIDISNKSKGLGDSIDKFTSKTGIKTVAEAVSKLIGLEGCGCEERKEYLNQLFPYETTGRSFKVIKDFSFEGKDYKKGDKFRCTKKDSIHHEVIWYVDNDYIKEIE